MTELCEIGLRYKTDKVPAVYHSYTPYYHELLKDRRETVRRVLEVGIGYAETMRWGNTQGYVTGASLYMWREYFTNAEIYALDNRRDILINDDSGWRIQSFYCDQSSEESLRAVVARDLPDSFDLIVDDGSHIPEHQALTARMLAPLLAPNGIYVIEDVINTRLELPLPFEVKEFPGSGIGDDRLIVMRKESA